MVFFINVKLLLRTTKETVSQASGPNQRYQLPLGPWLTPQNIFHFRFYLSEIFAID
jgi:hypothetical protein